MLKVKSSDKEEIMKTSLISRILFIAFTALLFGCAGFNRGCSSCTAQSFGADWVIVQMDNTGKPFRCWELHNVSVSNEERSDGIYWTNEFYGHLVHISNMYNRVQVVGNDWASAYAEVGLTQAACTAIRARRFDPVKNEYVLPNSQEH